jgi:hypothetical protein
MKDIQKIKEFFSKPLEEGTTEYFKPSIRKDKSNPNFLYVDIAYPAGSDVLSVGGSKTMGGQDREEGATKALAMGNMIAKKLQAKYNIEDIDVSDLKNGKVEVFAVSDDFIKMASPSLDEAKKETAVDMAKKQLDALGVKYEMSKTDKVRPFKVIYQPINKSDEFYDKFEDIVDLFNLKGVVKSSMSEVKEEDSYEVVWTDRDYKKHSKVFKNDPKGAPDNAKKKAEAFKKSLEDKDKKSKEGLYRSIDLNEAKEDKVDTITMDVPLFIRMLEYSREDAAEDMDLHDVTEKAISLGKERGILQMDDYDEIIGTTKKVDEANVTWSTLHRDNANEKLLKQSKLSSAEYQKAKKLQGFKADNYKWNTDEDLYVKVVDEGMGGQLDEPFFIEVSVRDARKALDLFDDQYSKSNIKMYGSNVYAATTPEDIYDLYYDLSSQDIEILDANIEDEELDEAELTEAYVPSNIKEFAKRKGVSSLVNKVAGWAEKVGKGIRGGTAIGYNYSTLILDMTYQGSEIRINTDNDTIELYDEPVRSFGEFQRVYLDNQEESDNGLEERIAEALNKINEELCPAGKAYIKRRQAAGEKSSAYLSGRGVKVCKGQMSGKAKKKK